MVPLRAYYDHLINLQKRADIYLLFHLNCDLGNENLRNRTPNLDQTVIGATALLVLTYFLVLLESRKYETSQITPTKC